MIRVTLELVSARDAARDRLLGVAYISNIGPASPVNPAICGYEVHLSKTIPGRTGEAWKTGRAAIVSGEMEEAIRAEVPSFDNVQRGAWDLLYLALKAIVGRRN